MTREQQRQIKAEKLAAKQAEKEQRKSDKIEARGWAKMVKVAKTKGAWIEETESHYLIFQTNEPL